MICKQHKTRYSQLFAVLAGGWLALGICGLCTAAQADEPPVRWHGTGKDFGRGWRQDPNGSWHGTGKDFGRGWRQDPNGSWHGTGRDFGRGWRAR